MTADRATLVDETQALEAAIACLGTPGHGGPVLERGELERRVLALCTTAQALPPAEAHALADTLVRLVESLDAAAQRLRAAGAGTGDSAPTAPDARRAAAAYGSASSRLRRGF